MKLKPIINLPCLVKDLAELHGLSISPCRNKEGYIAVIEAPRPYVGAGMTIEEALIDLEEHIARLHG